MKTSIQLYNRLKQKVKFCYSQLSLNKQEKTKGRKLAIKIIDIISLGLFKQLNDCYQVSSLQNLQAQALLQNLGSEFKQVCQTSFVNPPSSFKS